MPRLVKRPDGTGLCSHCCVAMAAGVPLSRVIEHFPDIHAGMSGKELAQALRTFGVPCAERFRRVSKEKPVPPQRALLSITRPKEEGQKRREKAHCLLVWDGKVLDPDQRWPEGYIKWKITSYLEIYPKIT